MIRSLRILGIVCAAIAALAVLAACRAPQAEPPGTSASAAAPPLEPAPSVESRSCDLDPDRCERLCAGCDDREGCFQAGGECPQLAGAKVWNQDLGDPGDDVFIGGCHFQYTDAACTLNARFLDGDACGPNTTIFEWVKTPCHEVCSDVRDCDVECRRHNLGAGVCVRLPNHCGPGLNSAYCKCELGQPPPPPAPGPNPTSSVSAE